MKIIPLKPPEPVTVRFSSLEAGDMFRRPYATGNPGTVYTKVHYGEGVNALAHARAARAVYLPRDEGVLQVHGYFTETSAPEDTDG